MPIGAGGPVLCPIWDLQVDGVTGSMTSGGTESILMAVKSARNYAKATRGITEPECVLPLSAHPAFAKVPPHRSLVGWLVGFYTFGSGAVRVGSQHASITCRPFRCAPRLGGNRTGSLNSAQAV